MKNKVIVLRSIFSIMVITGLAFSIIPAFAQSQDIISVTTPEPTYERGEIIFVSGEVTAIIGETPVVLQIFFGTNLIYVDQISVAQDGTYTSTINTEGPLWANGGEYTIRASYGTGNIAEASFEFITEDRLSEISDNFEVDAGSSGTFDVPYTIIGGTVENMIVDSDIFALIVIINAENDDGNITLELPRDSIDAKKSSGSDDIYIILIDGIEVPYEEISTNSQQRTIKIEFEEGDSDIEIIGTFIVPEFGTVAIMILATTIISTIVLSKNKLQITKQF